MIPAAATLDIRQKVRRRARLALLLRESAARAFRWIAIGFGSLVIIAGAILTPLPGHIGLPMLVLGLMIGLRYSFQARKQFIRWQKRHPKLVFPIRRLMRREPEVLLVVWQQMLRTEKMILRRPHWRVLKRSRKRARGYIARRMAPKRA
ncbi:hypothetical protein [Caulobacter sp. HMWF025]|uniref:hypothetical protein n=1 Tax=Caulobacter sp. HMWF025 TaxID=2056860 RepID=UPI000D3DC0FA|nr:hypothetical protein [Caulobacter sp. HMWF025]PTT10524.1 hypothetical protein DBR10_05315 [Caulobacter sp. HMWF025]